MPEAISSFSGAGSYTVQEHLVSGETVWVAIRARGAEWSWLTPREAARLGRELIDKYGNDQPAHTLSVAAE